MSASVSSKSRASAQPWHVFADVKALEPKRFSGWANPNKDKGEAHHPKMYRSLVGYDRYPSPIGRSETPLFGPSDPTGATPQQSSRLALWITSRDKGCRAGTRPADLSGNHTGKNPCKNSSLLASSRVFWPWPLAGIRTLSAAFRAQPSAFWAPRFWAAAPRRARCLAARPVSSATTCRRSSASNARGLTLNETTTARARRTGGFRRACMPDGGMT